MANLNKVMLIGNLTRDPEVKHTAKGTAVAEMGLAINRRYGASESGERKEETTFVDVVLWGRTAELAGQYLKKGRSVYIEGRLQLDTWEDKQTGQKRSRLRVIGEEMQFLGGGREGGDAPRGGGEYEGESRSQGARYNRPPATRPKPPADPDLDVEDDDIPF